MACWLITRPSEDLIGEHGLLKQLTKKLVERALEAEMAEHLGHARHDLVTNPTGNTRNGTSAKTLAFSAKPKIHLDLGALGTHEVTLGDSLTLIMPTGVAADVALSHSQGVCRSSVEPGRQAQQPRRRWRFGLDSWLIVASAPWLNSRPAPTSANHKRPLARISRR